jgi:hypothetical protein
MLLPENAQLLKHLRQKRHRRPAAVQDNHSSSGILVNFGDNVGSEGGVVAGQKAPQFE